MYPWLIPAWERLQRQVQQGHSAGALLLSGIPGMGKGYLAEQLAAAILCQHTTIAPCKTCHACQLQQAGNHPDFHRLGDDKGSTGIDAIRTLSRKLAESARLGGGKVALIEQADSMTEAAANALLKTLEEPAGQTMLILVSSQPARLLPTIRSRCQPWNLSLPDSGQVLAWLAEQGCQATATQLNINQGSPLQTRAYVEAGTDSSRQAMLAAFAALGQDPGQLPQLQSALLAQPASLGWLHLLLQDALHLSMGLDQGLRLPDCRELSRQLSRLGSVRLRDAIGGLLQLTRQYSLQGGRPPNRALQLSQWLNQWIIKGEHLAG